MNAWSIGHWYGLFSFIVWGTFPLYWKLFQGSDPLLLTCKRIFYTFITMMLIITISKRWKQLKIIMSKPNIMFQLFIATLLISSNWLVFVMAINKGATWESSLGYYLGPVISMAMGALLLKEKWTKVAKVSFILASTGILLFFVQSNSFPWMAIFLAASFACYGLVKKQLRLPSTFGITIEIMLLTPFALAYIWWAPRPEIIGHLDSTYLSLLLVLSGPLTFIPLYFYGKSAQLISLTELGMLQYISPTIQFFTAFFIFHESLKSERLLAFIFIWMAIIVYFSFPVIKWFSSQYGSRYSPKK